MRSVKTFYHTMNHYDSLIVSFGLFGATFAYRHDHNQAFCLV